MATAVWCVAKDELQERLLIIMQDHDEAVKLTEALRSEGLVAQAWMEAE